MAALHREKKRGGNYFYFGSELNLSSQQSSLKLRGVAIKSIKRPRSGPFPPLWLLFMLKIAFS